MATTAYAAGNVTGGMLAIPPSPALAVQLRDFPDGPVDITIRRYRQSRSHAQNAYLWGVVYAVLAEHTGHSRDELHEMCKAKFLPKAAALCDGNGEVIESFVIGGSTAALDTAQFGEYVDGIRAWALEKLSCDIPAPEQAVAA